MEFEQKIYSERRSNMKIAVIIQIDVGQKQPLTEIAELEFSSKPTRYQLDDAVMDRVHQTGIDTLNYENYDVSYSRLSWRKINE